MLQERRASGQRHRIVHDMLQADAALLIAGGGALSDAAVAGHTLRLMLRPLRCVLRVQHGPPAGLRSQSRPAVRDRRRGNPPCAAFVGGGDESAAESTSISGLGLVKQRLRLPGPQSGLAAAFCKSRTCQSLGGENA